MRESVDPVELLIHSHRPSLVRPSDGPRGYFLQRLDCAAAKRSACFEARSAENCGDAPGQPRAAAQGAAYAPRSLAGPRLDLHAAGWNAAPVGWSAGPASQPDPTGQPGDQLSHDLVHEKSTLTQIDAAGAVTELNDVWDIFSIEGLGLQSCMRPIPASEVSSTCKLAPR